MGKNVMIRTMNNKLHLFCARPYSECFDNALILPTTSESRHYYDFIHEGTEADRG